MNNEELTNAFKAANPFKKSRPVKQPTMAKKDLFEEITMSTIHKPTKVSTTTTTSYVERYKNSRLKFAFAFASVCVLLLGGTFMLMNRGSDNNLVAAEPDTNSTTDNEANGNDDSEEEQKKPVDWGPLAVLERKGEDSMAALNNGRLVIEEECVYIQTSNSRTLFVSHSDTVSWDGEKNAIITSSRSDNKPKFAFYDGDIINSGGGTITSENYENLDWVHPPAQGCDTSSIWIGSLAYDQKTSDWGPLAVLEPTEGADDALLTGELVIEEHCVYIQSTPEDRHLLALPNTYDWWDSKENAIKIPDLNDGPQQNFLRDGDAANVTGSQLSSAIDYQDLAWTQKPAQSCDTSQIWVGFLPPTSLNLESSVSENKPEASDTTQGEDNSETIDSIEMESFIGMSLEEAKERAEEAGYEIRVVSQDGNDLAVEDDLLEDRVNFSISEGLVTNAEIF